MAPAHQERDARMWYREFRGRVVGEAEQSFAMIAGALQDGSAQLGAGRWNQPGPPRS